MDEKLGAGLWRLADPKISITSVASMSIGAALAWGHAGFSWAWLLIVGLALFCMEVAKNAWGDIYDYDSGTDLAVEPEDRTDFSGGKRVLVDGILTRRQTWAIAFGFGILGLVLGALIVFVRELSVIWLVGCSGAGTGLVLSRAAAATGLSRPGRTGCGDLLRAHYRCGNFCRDDGAVGR